jgi:hypothetical protein
MRFIPYHELDPTTIAAMAQQFASPSSQSPVSRRFATAGAGSPAANVYARTIAMDPSQGTLSQQGLAAYRQLGSHYGAMGTPFPFGVPQGYQGGSGGMYPVGSSPAFNDLLQALMGRRAVAAGAPPNDTPVAYGGTATPGWLPQNVRPSFVPRF